MQKAPYQLTWLVGGVIKRKVKYRVSSNRRRPQIVAAASICGTCVHIISDNGQQASTRAVCVV